MTVYRRDDFAFPPARGRRGVEFHADGTFTELLIGRGDAPESGPAGRWSAAGQISRPTSSAGSLVSVGPDRLEIRWEE
ncbi:hypothetical protein [Kribbella sp. NPDC051620]|uniref:hypothetical protein n=1 Tax=Kribbella sp. NPDC051620 TaxID=3364120 RepID=UPI0037A59A8A